MIYNTYDNLVSLENTDLFNGTEFTDLFLNTDGTYRYLKEFDYSKGSVVYMGQYHVDVLLKYDLLEDNLLTRSNDNLSIFNTRLISDFVSEFNLHNLHFVKLDVFGKSEFFEMAHQGKTISLFIKHQKKQRSKALSSGIQYSFKSENYYLVNHNETYTQVSSKRDFRREFPSLKTEIDEFFKRFQALYKQDKDEFIRKLIAYLDTFQSKYSELKTS